jgi:hypothetical protein
MQIIAHRINTIAELQALPTKYGVEIDVRSNNGQLLLTHDPVDTNKKYDGLEEYLQHFQHAFIVFNMKEAGCEQQAMQLAEKNHVSKDRYFLLDVEFPYLYRATRSEGVRQIAVRYSEAEPIEAVEAQLKDGVPLLDWVWIDTNTTLPLNADVVKRLQPFKTCLVCPDRWGRPEDIEPYIYEIKKLHFNLDAVMTSVAHISTWEAAFK